MTEVESHIYNIVGKYLFERMSARTFKKIEKELTSISINEHEYEVKNPTFVVDKNTNGKLSILGKIFNKTLNEEYGDLKLTIEPE